MLENITTHNSQMYHEVVKPMCKRIKTKYSILSCVLVVLSAILFFVDVSFAIGLTIGTIISIIFLIISYARLSKKWVKQLMDRIMTAYHTDHVEQHYYFYEDKSVTKKDEGNITYLYKDIIGKSETEHYFLLEFPGRLYIILDKNGFINGDLNNLKEILRSAGVKNI